MLLVLKQEQHLKSKIKFKFLFFIFILLVSLASVSAGYNFGSMQPEKVFSLNPGQEFMTKIYFYNVYGDKPTHVKLEIVEQPEDWDVELIPELEEVGYDVSGIIQTIEENLVVEESEVLDEPGKEIEGIEYIRSKVGYIGANFVELKIFIPEDEELGETKNILVKANAFWLGSSGMLDINQEREFDYTINIKPEEYYEKKIEPETEEEQSSGITGAVTGLGSREGIYIGAIVLLVLILIGFWIKRRS